MALKKPLIIAPIDGNDDIFLDSQKAKKEGADCIELRIDLWPKKQIDEAATICANLKKKLKIPMIATVRYAKEQGPTRGSVHLTEEKRKEIYESVLKNVDFIDIELGADSINDSLIKKAHVLGKKVILSSHNFRSIPTSQNIKKLSQKFRRLKGDIFKIAATPKNVKESLRFMLECSSLKGFDKIFIPMGKVGTIFRIIGFSFGSLFTYGCMGKEVAPGQMGLKELKRRILSFYGE